MAQNIKRARNWQFPFCVSRFNESVKQMLYRGTQFCFLLAIFEGKP
jgi:hypothetical protein